MPGRLAAVHVVQFRRYVLGFSALCLIAVASACNAQDDPRLAIEEAYAALSEEERRAPEWAVAGLDVAPGLEATLFAHEPMLASPSNMDIDHRGRVWVVDVYNYRLARNPNIPQRPEGDRILILEDTTGDGIADTQKIFYQDPEINVALGISVFGNQVVVAASPYILILTDENGDDTADRREVLFTGISGQDHDHGAHAVVFGPDGKFYFNFGDAGRQIHDRDGNLIVDMAGNPVEEGPNYRRGMVFRSNPDGSDFEVVAHNFRNNYEVAVDAFGTIWQSDNDDDGYRSVRINYVMEYGNHGYVDEMTGAGWRTTTRTNMEEEIPDRHWHQNDPGVVPNLLITGAGSPTGILFYEGRLLPEVYWDQMIHADAGPNIVRAYPVETDGAGYTASVVDMVRGTRDRWFRPSDVTTAPDGSVFIADWYDPMVGGHEKIDDVGRGRVFRVAPPGTPYRVPPVDLSTPEGAVEALVNPNMATQYLAWTTLHGLQEAAEPALLSLWNAAENPRHRARALWLLTKIEGRGDHYVQEGLADADENIRITAIRAARQLDVDLIPYLQEVVRDASPQVRREVAIALRHDEAPEAADLWAELALQHDGEDRWYLEALGIGADRQWDRFFDAWLDRVGQDWDSPAGRDIVWRSRAPAAMSLMTELIADGATSAEERLRYFRAFDFHEDPAKDRELLSLMDVSHADEAQIRALALRHVGDTDVVRMPEVRTALDETLVALRGTQTFVDLVGRFELREQREQLVEVAIAQPDSDVALDAVRQLIQLDGESVVRSVLAGGDVDRSVAFVTALGRYEDSRSKDLLEEIALDDAHDMRVQRIAVRGLGRGWGGEGRLLGLIQDGVLPSELHGAAADVLLAATRTHIREGATQYLGLESVAEGRDVPPIPQLVARTGNPLVGRQVYERACQICHVVEGEGTQFGPDLTEIGDKLPKEALYLSILEPDAGISFGYEGSLLRLSDGSQVTGIIASETADAVDVQLPTGATERYARSDVVSIERLEGSLMPAGLHLTMTEQELVDLVEYLTTLREPLP